MSYPKLFSEELSTSVLLHGSECYLAEDSIGCYEWLVSSKYEVLAAPFQGRLGSQTTRITTSSELVVISNRILAHFVSVENYCEINPGVETHQYFINTTAVSKELFEAAIEDY